MYRLLRNVDMYHLCKVLIRIDYQVILIYIRPGQTFADQELLLISTESPSPPHVLNFCLYTGELRKYTIIIS
jgi:hypothetical protein